MILTCENLHTGYGRIPALFGAGLSLAEGEAIGVWGHNGMGKTTLLKAIMGYLPLSAGSIRFRGSDISRQPVYKRALSGIGYVPQGREIFPGLSVADNLRIGCRNGSSDHAATITGVLEHFPRLRTLLDRTGGLLSGGEQQLLALARCLCGNPTLLLLDEPTEGIQPSIIEEMIGTLQVLRKSHGLSIVIVEQNQDCITQLSDRVLVMQKGVITKAIDAGCLSAETGMG